MESGLNDPVAVMLTIGMVEVWRGHPGVGDWLTFGLLHLVGGLAVGLVVGLGARVALRRLQLPSASSYPVLALAVAGLSYGVATELGSSGFLAVYLTGLVLGRKRRLVRSLLHFHEGLAAAAEAVLFLMLGLLVFPSHLLDVLGPALIVALGIDACRSADRGGSLLAMVPFQSGVNWRSFRGRVCEAPCQSCWPPSR